MITFVTSVSLRSIMDELNEKKMDKENIVTMFQNNDGHYVVMCHVKPDKDGTGTKK